MKKFARLSFLLVFVFVLGLGSSLTAFAQGGTTNPVCNGLVDADCQQLTGVLQNMQTVKSFSISNWTLKFNLDAGDGKPVSLTADGTAEFMMPADPKANPEQVFAHFIINNFAATGSGNDQSGSAEVLLKEGMTYVKWKDQWYGEKMSQSNEASIATALADISRGNLDMTNVGMDLTGVFTTARDANTTDVPDTTHFTTTLAIDKLLTAFLASPQGGQMLGSAMGGGAGGAQMTPEDMQLVAMMLAPMLTGTTINFGVWTGNTDKYIHRSALDVVLSLDLSSLDQTMKPIAGEFHFQADLGKYNETFTADAPTDFKPLSELNAQINGAVPNVGGLMGGSGQ